MYKPKVTLVSPIGLPRSEAPRGDFDWSIDLNRKTIALIDNTKPKADLILELVGGFVQESFSGVQIVRRQKPGPGVPAPFLHELAGKTDLVVMALAD
ncbi:MAG: hypothetical protein HYX87_09690 [Chloroflexi bacterium]|nr:hypothetical protein [Chloroflexota bacterium]